MTVKYILKNCRAEGSLEEWEYLLLDECFEVVETLVCLPAKILAELDRKFQNRPKPISPMQYYQKTRL